MVGSVRVASEALRARVRAARSLVRMGACALLTGALFVALLATPIGALVAAVWPYAVIPVIGLLVFLTDRSALPFPLLLWTLGASLLAGKIIADRPDVPVLGLRVPMVVALAAAWGIGAACVRPRLPVVRSICATVAGAMVVALLVGPSAQAATQLRGLWDQHVQDARNGGVIHRTVLDATYGADYISLMQMVREKTPESAVIAFPDQNAYPVAGNPELANYFLYPRVIKSQNDSRTPVFDVTGASYIVGMAQNSQNVWPLFSVPIRTYAHPVARHVISFGEIIVRAPGATTRVSPASLQPWQTNAERTVESDTIDRDGTRTVSLLVASSVTDPWLSPVTVPLASTVTFDVPITDQSVGPSADERAALLAEVRGPGGETALFASKPTLPHADPQALTMTDLFPRASEYARARGWPSGPLTVTRIGLEMGWQVPLSQTKTNTLAEIETGERALPDGPDSFALLARDAQHQIRIGNANGGVGLYAASLLLRPDNLDVQLALGEAFRAASQWKEGAQYFTALLTDYPADPWIRYRLASMQREVGDRPTARETVAPLVFNMPIAHIVHPAHTVKGRAQIAATLSGATQPLSDITTPVTLTYDTGDGSPGQVYASTNGGPASLEMSGARGTIVLPRPTAKSRIVYNLYAGTDHATLLDSVTVEFLPSTVPPKYTVWAKMLAAQLAAETGDTTGARGLYEAVAVAYPGEYRAMAQAALAHLGGG